MLAVVGMSESMSEPRRFKFKDGELVLGPRTLVMGVLNVTPDSFYDGGMFLDPGAAIKRAGEMVAEGADIIDIGGESTRPGAMPVDADRQLARVLGVVREVSRTLDTPISIDTTDATVARACLEEGASIVNDISALGFDPEMAGVAAELGAGLVLMHTPSRPRDMQEHTHYDSLVDDIKAYLAAAVLKAEESGVNPQSIVIDPGIGFGKTPAQNLSLINRLPEFQSLGKPVLVGTSRKSFIAKVLGPDKTPGPFGTAATVALAAAGGADIVRVHDVGAMREVLALADAIVSS